MKPSDRLLNLIATYLIAMTVCGCSSGNGLEGETGTARGRLTYQGKPLPAGTSVLMIHKNRGQVAVGKTDADGHFQLKMRGGNDILVGDYAVGVSPPETAPVADDITASIPTKDENWDLVPAKFLTPETSGETAHVAAGPNDFQIDFGK